MSKFWLESARRHRTVLFKKWNRPAKHSCWRTEALPSVTNPKITGMDRNDDYTNKNRNAPLFSSWNKRISILEARYNVFDASSPLITTQRLGLQCGRGVGLQTSTVRTLRFPVIYTIIFADCDVCLFSPRLWLERNNYDAFSAVCNVQDVNRLDKSNTLLVVVL